jgi:hypothetical protein
LPPELFWAKSCEASFGASWDLMTRLSSGCWVDPRRAEIASRSFSIAERVLELETAMTTESLPFAKRILTDTAPRLAGSSEISNSFTA